MFLRENLALFILYSIVFDAEAWVLSVDMLLKCKNHYLCKANFTL